MLNINKIFKFLLITIFTESSQYINNDFKILMEYKNHGIWSEELKFFPYKYNENYDKILNNPNINNQQIFKIINNYIIKDTYIGLYIDDNLNYLINHSKFPNKELAKQVLSSLKNFYKNLFTLIIFNTQLSEINKKFQENNFIVNNFLKLDDVFEKIHKNLDQIFKSIYDISTTIRDLSNKTNQYNHCNTALEKFKQYMELHFQYFNELQITLNKLNRNTEELPINNGISLKALSEISLEEKSEISLEEKSEISLEEKSEIYPKSEVKYEPNLNKVEESISNSKSKISIYEVKSSMVENSLNTSNNYNKNKKFNKASTCNLCSIF